MKKSSKNDLSWIENLLGNEASYLLDHKCSTIDSKNIVKPGPDFVDRVLSNTDRPNSVLRNLQTLINHWKTSNISSRKATADFVESILSEAQEIKAA